MVLTPSSGIGAGTAARMALAARGTPTVSTPSAASSRRPSVLGNGVQAPESSDDDDSSSSDEESVDSSEEEREAGQLGFAKARLASGGKKSGKAKSRGSLAAFGR